MHGKRFAYPNTADFKLSSKIKIYCPLHGDFTQIGYHHLAGKGCKKCADELRSENQTSTREVLLQKFESIHGDRYRYSMPPKASYGASIEVKCKEHGFFSQLVKVHLQGKGCPKCSLSKGENAIALFLQRAGIEFEVEFAVPEISTQNPVRFDFYIPASKAFIEFDGQHHFMPVNFGGISDEKALEIHQLVKERDKRKDNWAKVNGFHVLRIKFDEDVNSVLTNFFSAT